MKSFYALAGAVSLVWLLASYDDGMAACVERNSFTTCHHALNR